MLRGRATPPVPSPHGGSRQTRTTRSGNRMSTRWTAQLVAAVVLAFGLVAVVHVSGDGIVISGENKLDQRLRPGKVSVVDVARALDFGEQQGQRSLYATLGERIPGVILVIDPDERALSTVEARALGRVQGVVEVGGLDIDRPDRPPDVAGDFRFDDWRTWELYLADDAAAVLVVVDRGGQSVLVDARLLDAIERRDLLTAAPDLRPDAPRAEVSTRPGPIAAAIRETGLLIALVLLGGLLLPVATFAGRARPAMALLVGAAVQGGAGASLSGMALLVVPAMLAVGLAGWLRWRQGPVGWTLADRQALLVTSGALLTLSLLVRTRGHVVVSTDGGSYLVRAAMQAAGDSAALGSKGAAYSALHATGMLVGADGLFALGPALLLAATILIARSALGVLRDGARRLRALRGIGGSRAGVGPVLLALALGLLVVLPFTSPGIRFSSMLVHAHLLVAAQSLALVILWMTRDPSGNHSPIGGEVAAAAALAGSIVLARPEGFIIPLAVLIGTVSARRTRPPWIAVFVVTGLAVTAQYGFDAANLGTLIEVWRDGDRARGALGRTGTGLIGPAIVLAPLLLRAIPVRWRAQLPLLAAVVAWGGLIMATRTGALGLDRSLEIGRDNVFTGAGGWGITLPVLAVIALFAVGLLLPRLGQPRLGPLVTLAVLFAPLALFSKNLGDGIGRVHWHDSVNRIWMHVLLVLVLLAVLALAELAAGAPARRRWLTRVAAPVIALLMVATARLWDPVLALADPVEQVISAIPGPALSATPELAADRQILHAVQLQLPDTRELQRARSVHVCADIRFGTYGRSNTGAVDVRFSLAERTVGATIDSATLVDNAIERVCWDIGAGPEALDELQPLTIISLRGLGPGPAPALMLGGDGSPDITVAVRWVEPLRWNAPLVQNAPMALAVLLGAVLLAWSWGPGPYRVRGPHRAGGPHRRDAYADAADGREQAAEGSAGRL